MKGADSDVRRHRPGRRPPGTVALLAVLVAAAAIPADSAAAVGAAATWFVDAGSGSDAASGTSPGLAWRSLERVEAASLGPGDTVLLRRGASWTGELTLAASGTASAPVTLGAFGEGPAPTIRGGGCVSLSGSHLVVRDLAVEDCDWAGISIWGSDNTVERTTVRGNVAGVHLGAGSSRNRVVGNRVVDNDRMSVLTEAPGDDSGAFGLLLNGDDNEIAGNVISGSDAFSWDYGRDGAAIEVYGGRRNLVHHNLAVENNMFSELGNPRSAGNTYSYNVVRSSLRGAGFITTRGADSRYGPVTGTRLYHNTVLLSGVDSQGVVCHAGCGPGILTMHDNVVQAGWKAAYADAPFDEGHNVYWGGRLELKPSPTSVQADPAFVDPGAGDLRLRAESPAVDTAATGGDEPDFDGEPVPLDGDGDGVARPDRGAFERGEAGGSRWAGWGYWLVATDGGVFGFGDATFLGSTGGLRLNKPMVAMASRPSGDGYWTAASDGGVFSFGLAPFLGSAAGIPLRSPVVAVAATPTGRGYWVAAADGGVFAFGDAAFAGSAARAPLRSPVVGLAATPTGRGYWLVAADGGVFAFGDAAFAGSAGALRLGSPVVGLATTPTGRGYWLVAADGGVFAFGDAAFAGSAGALRLGSPVVSVATTPTGRGYWLAAADGGVFAFGDAPYLGSMGLAPLNGPVVGSGSAPSGHRADIVAER